MAKRVSKYSLMVNTIVNLGHGEVLVTNFKKVEKTSKKTGNVYYVYMVELEQKLWCTTTQFKNGTYCKKLNKIREEKFGRKLTTSETSRKMTNEDFYQQKIKFFVKKLQNKNYTFRAKHSDNFKTKQAKRKNDLTNMAFVEACRIFASQNN